MKLPARLTFKRKLSPEDRETYGEAMALFSLADMIAEDPERSESLRKEARKDRREALDVMADLTRKAGRR